jgi:hypothetical protein
MTLPQKVLQQIYTTLASVPILTIWFVVSSTPFVVNAQSVGTKEWWNSCTNAILWMSNITYKTDFVKLANLALTKYQNWWQERFFTDRDLTTIIVHAKCSCCELGENLPSCESFSCPVKNYFAQTSHLFDQLIDIGMKKLDGEQEKCDKLQIDCSERWLKRRERIKKEAIRPEWSPARLIQEEFALMWWDKETLKKITWTTLYHDYNRMCREAEYLAQNTLVELIPTQASENFSTTNRRWWCFTLVDKRYEQEAAFIRTMIVQKNIDFLMSNLNSYLYKYSIKTRLTWLLSKFTDYDACIATVFKKANDKTEICK